MAADLGLYLTSINSSKKNVMRDPEADPSVVTQYPSFIINRLLSYHQDAVLIVNAINMLPFLDKQLQYEFLLHGLPKGKRFSKLAKAVTPENLDLVKRYYGFSNDKALEVLDLHTPEDIEDIRHALDEGGVMVKRKK
jgi:Bacteriophage clamp loader A subunit